MANSAIRIPIPGSIIDAASAQEGDLLYFNATLGQGGSFVNFKPLIQDIRPFTKNSVVDFYVSVKNETETTSWNLATVKAMTLAAALDGNNQAIESDMRMGVNLQSGRPSHTLEVVGDLKVWGGGDIIGRINFYQQNNTTIPPNLIFSTPLTSHTDADLNSIQASLRTGRVLSKHPVSNQTYFARMEDVAVAGNGIAINNNTISVGSISSVSSPTGFTIRLDSDRVGGESEEFRVVESVAISGGTDADFSLLRLVRQHKPIVNWVNGSFVLGDDSSQSWPAVKMGVGAGTRFLPSGFLVEDGAPVTADDTDESTTDQEAYTSTSSGGSVYARLFGAVASNPADIIITGTAGQPNTAVYYDSKTGVSVSTAQSNGRFGFLPGIGTMWTENGYANPGSFVAAFLNKHADGGGIKVKASDTNNDEFALFMENAAIEYDTTKTTGGDGELEARNKVIFVDPSSSVSNGQYRNILAQNAPVFTVRASTGDTFVRGFLVMPFLPGIASDFTGTDATPTPSGTGVVDGTVIFTTHTTVAGIVSIRKYTWNVATNAWIGPGAEYTLPKGAVYCDASGTLKIVRTGTQIPNHGLNGVSLWRTSD